MRKVSKTAAAVVLTVSALVPLSSQTWAAPTPKTTNSAKTVKQETVHTLANLPPVKITAKSLVQLSDVNILTLDGESILTYTLTIQNKDNKTIDLLDYWSKVKTTSGTTYSTSLMTKDKDKKKLAAGSSTTLTYTARIANHIKPQNLIFQVVKWDFSQPEYEALKGQFKIPADYLTSTPANQSKTLWIADARVKAKVGQVASYVSGDYKYVNVLLNMTNVGYKLFEDPKMKFVIRSSAGASYLMTADPTTSVDYKIQPKDTKTLHLMAQIPKKIELSNMELQVALDDETAKQSLPIATMQLPGEGDNLMTVKPNVEKFIQAGNGKIAVQVTSAVVNKNDLEHELSVRFAFRNTSGATITLPKYQFELQTSDGYRMPIKAPALENMTLQPLEQRFITLPVTVPPDISIAYPRLFMNLPTAEDNKEKIAYPLAIFALQTIHTADKMVGTEQFIQTKDGVFGVTLSSLQRLPWSDGDLVNAKITISNDNIKTLQLPELTGSLQVDSVKLTEGTKLIFTQPDRLIGAGMSMDIFVTAKVPSYLKFDQLQVALLEKIGEESTDWIQFSNTGAIPEVAGIAKGASFTFDTPGRKQELGVISSRVYLGPSSDLVYTELDVKNLEEHQMDLSQIVGAYQTSDGQTYKATVSQIDTPAGPEEKSVVAVWTKIPKRVSITDMKLIVGEGITDNKLTPVKGEATGYINAVALELGVSNPTANKKLRGLEIFPYKLAVKDVESTLSGSSMNLSFTYDLTRNRDYTIGEFGHKYLFEVEDSSGRVFEKEFVPETDLLLTGDGRASFSFNDPLFKDLTEDDEFKLTVYDLFQGYKIKLGSQSFEYDDETDTDE